MSTFDTYIWGFVIAAGVIAFGVWSAVKGVAGSEFGKGFAKGFLNRMKR